MAEDLEVGVLLEPKNNLEDDVGPVSVGQEQDGGGGLSAAQEQQQEGIISGGVTEALAAAGAIGAILSQLKSVTGLLSAVLGFLSRSLLPAVEVLADLLRPLISGINDFISDPTGTVSNITGLPEGSEITRQENREIQALTALQDAGQASPLGGALATSTALQTELLTDFLGLGGPKSADTTGEAQKQSFLQTLEDGKRDKTGASK